VVVLGLGLGLAACAGSGSGHVPDGAFGTGGVVQLGAGGSSAGGTGGFVDLPHTSCSEALPEGCTLSEHAICKDEAIWSRVDLGDCQLSPDLAATVQRATAAALMGSASCLTELQLELVGTPGAEAPVSNLDGLECLAALVDLTVYSSAQDPPAELASLKSVASLPNLAHLTLSGIGFTDYEGLVTLRLTSVGIFQTDQTNVEFLRGMTSLTEASLTGRPLVDLGAVSSWPELRRLYMVGTGATDSLFLLSLDKLEEVYLQYMPELLEVDGLENASALRYLSLENSAIESIAGLSGALALEYLNLRRAVDAVGPKLASLEGLEDHHALTNLEVPAGTITDLGPLAGLEGLSYLTLVSNRVTDFAVLATLPNLEFVDLSDNDIAELPDLATFSARALNLTGNHITDLGPLGTVDSELGLSLAGNGITDIPDLGETQVTGLGLSDNQIADISALGAVTTLRGLDLANNLVTDIGPLASLTLWSLSLANNPIEDFAPLAHLRGVSTLDLSGCGLSDLSFLSELESASMLVLSDNAISDLTPLVGAALSDFDLSNNLIEELPDELAIPRPMCEQADLTGNPLSAAARAHLAELCAAQEASVVWDEGDCLVCLLTP